MITRYVNTWKNTFNVKGRSTRSEYNTFYFGTLLLIFILATIDGLFGTLSNTGEPMLATIFQIASIIPSITVGIRRLHDMDYRGWWILFPLVIVALIFGSGTVTENRFGDNPRLTT